MKDLQVSSISLSICVMKASCTTFMIKLMKTHKMIRLGTICLISGCCSQCGFTHPPSTHVRISFKPTAPSCIGKDKWLHTVSHQDEKLTMDIPCRRSRKLNCGQRSFLVVSMQCITYITVYNLLHVPGRFLQPKPFAMREGKGKISQARDTPQNPPAVVRMSQASPVFLYKNVLLSNKSEDSILTASLLIGQTFQKTFYQRMSHLLIINRNHYTGVEYFCDELPVPWTNSFLSQASCKMF